MMLGMLQYVNIYPKAVESKDSQNFKKIFSPTCVLVQSQTNFMKIIKLEIGGTTYVLLSIKSFVTMTQV